MSKDCYQTPPEVFAYMNAEFNFKLDAAASAENTLIPEFFMDESGRNCLTECWFSAAGMEHAYGWYSWLNPPYSNIGPFVARAAEMAAQGIGTVMLVMMDQSVGWYKEAIKTCQEVRLVIGGRLSFIDPKTGKPAAGNNKGSMFLIWHPFGRTPVQYSHIDRDAMLAAGREILEQRASEPVSNPYKLPADSVELSGNSGELPEHIADAGKMVGTDIDDGTKPCISKSAENEKQEDFSGENEKQIAHCVSFSGGRTSAYMVHLIEQMRKSGEITGTVEYIFMDTGAEHPLTYTFIRLLVKRFGINLTCLQADFNQPIGVGQDYKVVSVEDLKHDPVNGPFGQMMIKYGVPTVSNAFCTSRMKEEIQTKYCDQKHGKDGYRTYLGIRYDEPKRLVGHSIHRQKSTYLNLRDDGYTDDDISQMFVDIKTGVSDIQSYKMSDLSRTLLTRRFEIIYSKNLMFLAEMIDIDKPDVIEFWKGQSFDLGIDEHLGNCVFCIKKSVNKIALAAADEPELAGIFQTAVANGSNRLNEKNKIPKGVMYRGKNSLESIIQLFSLQARDDIAKSVRGAKQLDTGSCSESCEGFAGDDEDPYQDEPAERVA